MEERVAERSNTLLSNRLIGMLLACLPALALPWINAGDTALYSYYGQRLVGGLVPYSDFPAEYPPAALALMALPALATQSAATYGGLFVGMMWLFDAASKAACVRAVAAAPNLFWLLATGLTLPLLPVYYNHFDVAPMACSVLSVVAWQRRPDRAAGWLWLGAAVGLKVVPIVLLPLGLWLSWRAGHSLRVLSRHLAAFGACVALPIFIAFVAAGPASLMWVTFHRERGLHVASSYAAVGYLVCGLGRALPSVSAYGSLQLAAPWAERCARASVWVTAALLGLTAWSAWRGRRQADQVFRLLSCSMCGLLLANKAFSPQYMAWLTVPTLAAAFEGLPRAKKAWRRPWSVAVVALLALACAATAQLHAWEVALVGGDAYRQAWLLGRLLALAALFCLLAAPDLLAAYQRSERAPAS